MSIFGDPILTGIAKASASGPIASFSDGAKGLPLRSLVANIDPVQDLHGYDSPWPAGGGKNKLQVTAITQTVNGITFTVNADGTVSANGTTTALTTLNLATASVTFTESTILSGCPSGGGESSYAIQLNAITLETGSGITIPANTEITNVRIRIASGATVSNVVFKPMIRLATVTDATFAPYSNICPISGWSAVNVWLKPTYDPTANPTATIQLGQTVYGGTLDVTNGVLTVDRAMVDMGTLSWFRTTSYAHSVFYANITDAAMNGNQICSILKNVGGTSGAATFSQIAPDCSFSKCIANSQTFVRYDIYTTTADFTAAMSGVQLVYELATPITIQLTPQEISTLKDVNNIWADTGDVDVEYLKQSLKYIGSYVH